MCPIILWKFEIELLNLIPQLKVMVVVYILADLHSIIEHMTYIKIPSETTKHIYLEEPSNGMIYNLLI